MASVTMLMRAAVRWRMPVSEVGMLGSGFRWKLARRMVVRPSSMTMAPSILDSSNRRLAVKAMLSGKPSSPEARTRSSSPMQMRAPRWAAKTMSSAPRSAVPGAVRRMASSMRSCASCVWATRVPSLASPVKSDGIVTKRGGTRGRIGHARRLNRRCYANIRRQTLQTGGTETRRAGRKRTGVREPPRNAVSAPPPDIFTRRYRHPGQE